MTAAGRSISMVNGADGQTLYVYAAPLPDFTPAATYSFSGEYLVTQSDMGRLIWQRRG